MEFEFSNGPRWVPDDAFLQRIKRCYRLAVKRYVPTQTMWLTIDDRRRDIHEALLGDDDERTRSLLSHPEQTALYYGVDVHTNVHLEKIRRDASYRGHIEELIALHLLRAAESIGGLPLFGAETPSRRRPARPDTADEILGELDNCLTGRLRFPNPFPGEYGAVSERGIISWKAPMGFYQANQLVHLSALVGGSRILEIGPGMGRAALFARQLGLGDYTTIDLPLGMVAQACFLGAALGSEAIWLAGDDDPRRAEQIRILPPNYLDEDSEAFDIIVNADSLSEMSRDDAQAYFDLAVGHAKVFLSINHEGNPFRVKDLQAGRPGVVSLRHPSAIRLGFVEEYFFMPGWSDQMRKPSRAQEQATLLGSRSRLLRHFLKLVWTKGRASEGPPAAD